MPGVIAPQGPRYARELAELIEACDETIPFEVCEALAPLVVQLRNLDEAIARLDPPPSKFIGYQDIDAETYVQGADEADGRRTEAQLQSWFKVVDPSTSCHNDLYAALSSFLAEYGKTPSTKTRISVLRAIRSLTPSNTEYLRTGLTRRSSA